MPDARRHSLVFDWLTEVQDFLRQTDPVIVRKCQPELTKDLDALLLCNAAPPVRRLSAEAMARMYSKGNPFGAYQVVITCADLVQKKPEAKESNGQRLFALEVIGTLFQELGRLLGSCMMDTISSLLIGLKVSEATRCETLTAIGKVLSGLENSASMFHAKIYKAVRPYMTHSSGRVSIQLVVTFD